MTVLGIPWSTSGVAARNSLNRFVAELLSRSSTVAEVSAAFWENIHFLEE